MYIKYKQEAEVLDQLNETRLTYRGERVPSLISTGHYYVTTNRDTPKPFPHHGNLIETIHAEATTSFLSDSSEWNKVTIVVANPSFCSANPDLTQPAFLVLD